MNEIRRIILWLVFIFSLALLWDQWEISHGRKPMFMPSPTKATQTAPAAATSSDPATPPAVANNTAVPQPDNNSSNTIKSERVEISTDVLKLTFDTQGGSLLRAELLKHADVLRPGQNVVLFDDSKERVYLGQTGLIGSTSSEAWPTHKSAMRFSGPTALKEGEDQLTFQFQSLDAGDVSLVKTYTLTRGSYVLTLQHDITNNSAAAISPQLYVQLVRDGNKLEGESAF
ncbi:MAG: membrane protein insertase YidC, partial [Limnohabitans sp.]